VTEVGALYGRLICGWLGVVGAWSTHATVSASVLPAAGSMQAGLAAAVGATSTGGGHGLHRSSIK